MHSLILLSNARGKSSSYRFAYFLFSPLCVQNVRPEASRLTRLRKRSFLNPPVPSARRSVTGLR